MIGLLRRLFVRVEPSIVEARPEDAASFSSLHATSFQRGWSEEEFERLLADRNVVAHRAALAGKVTGFILSRIVAGEAEILSVAIAGPRRGRGIGRRLLDLHLRRLAGLGVRTVFLEVDEDNQAARRLYRRARFAEAGRRKGYYPRPQGAGAAMVLRRELT